MAFIGFVIVLGAVIGFVVTDIGMQLGRYFSLKWPLTQEAV
ncbi:MAG: hypothetical protein ACI90A_001766 [Shewanella sp.]|jgi:hypothetical protein